MVIGSDGLRAFLDQTAVGVLATSRLDGTPRQSVVYFLFDGSVLSISTESRRAKARDIARTGRASLCVVGPEKPFPSVTVEGPARIRTTDIGEATRQIFTLFRGGPVEIMTDPELAAIDRVIVEIEVESVYGASYLDGHR